MTEPNSGGGGDDGDDRQGLFSALMKENAEKDDEIRRLRRRIEELEKRERDKKCCVGVGVDDDDDDEEEEEEGEQQHKSNSSSSNSNSNSNSNNNNSNNNVSQEGSSSPSTPCTSPGLSASTTNTPTTGFCLETAELLEAANRSLRGGGASGGVAEPVEPVHFTNPSSILEQEGSMVRGENAKCHGHGGGEIDQALFKQTCIEWGEDSPLFRRKLATLGDNVNDLRLHMLRLVEVCRRYCEAGNAFSEVGRTFAAELRGEVPALASLSPILRRFGETLEEIQNYREALLISLETTFSQPMEIFVKREVKEVKKKRVEMTSLLEEHEQNLTKMLALKNNAEEDVVIEREAAVASSKIRFELVRFDLVNLLNQLDVKKKLQLVERVCSGLYANLGFFHQCHTLVAVREPAMRDLQRQLQVARKDFSKTERLWKAKKTQLEVELSHGLFPRPNFSGESAAAAATTRLSFEGPSGNDTSMEADDDFISSPARLSEDKKECDIVKHGFLWKKVRRLRARRF